MHNNLNYDDMEGIKMTRTKKQGALVYDSRTERYDIRFGLTDYLGGLHCGECLDVKLDGKWIPTRMEMGEEWYLVGIKVHDLRGLVVRI